MRIIDKDCAPQIGLVVEGCGDCRILNKEPLSRDPANPFRTLPVGLCEGGYFLEYGSKIFPFLVRSNGSFFYIECPYNNDVEVIGPSEENPVIHTIKIKT
jgi:hypothetical protein